MNGNDAACVTVRQSTPSGRLRHVRDGWIAQARGFRGRIQPETSAVAGFPGGCAQADAGVSGGFQRCGRSSRIRDAGWFCTRVSTSIRYAMGLRACFSHEATNV